VLLPRRLTQQRQQSNQDKACCFNPCCVEPYCDPLSPQHLSIAYITSITNCTITQSPLPNMQQPPPDLQQTSSANFPAAVSSAGHRHGSTSESMPPPHFLFNPATQGYIMAPTHPNYHTHGVPSLSYEVFQQYPTHSGNAQQFPTVFQPSAFGYYATPPHGYGGYSASSWGHGYGNQPMGHPYGAVYGPPPTNATSIAHRGR
jgi:hypothetical protein